MLILSMTIEQTLLQEIEESKRWFNLEKDESTYKRDLAKRIELINWVLENMKNPEINICELIESKMNEIIDTVNKTDSAIEADPLHRDLRILDWILYQVCCNEIKKFEGL
jgi:nicotinic acid mononucleotide adenylyltransferase